MRKYVLLLLAAAAFYTSARCQNKMTAKDMEKHEKAIQKSKEKCISIWDWDTVYNCGQPYCIIYEVSKGFGRPHDFSVRSLSGKELIYVQYGSAIDYNAPHAPNTPPTATGYYLYIFDGTKNAAELCNNRPFKEIVRNKLIDNGITVDSSAESKFIMSYPRRLSLQPSPVPAPAAPH